MSAAARASGRDPEAVRLIAVTKYVQSSVARALFELGCHDLGESRPQDLWKKADALADLPVRWHQIGHLQRNKIRRSLPHLHCVQAGDSVRLLQALEDAAAEREQMLSVLLEVNISGDASKHGFSVQQLPAVVEQLGTLRRVRVDGLMAMGGLESSPDERQTQFARLRELRDRLSAGTPSPHRLQELSMGMSHDFELAIEEGATMVRIGSILFDGI